MPEKAVCTLAKVGGLGCFLSTGWHWFVSNLGTINLLLAFFGGAAYLLHMLFTLKRDLNGRRDE